MDEFDVTIEECSVDEEQFDKAKKIQRSEKDESTKQINEDKQHQLQARKLLQRPKRGMVNPRPPLAS